MIGVRLFLWALVAAMTIQGFLNADTYGTSPTMLGGMGLTLLIWKESVTSVFSDWKGVPRAFVVAALKETVKHPEIQHVPRLQRRSKEIRKALDEFRTEYIAWRVEFSDLVGALQSDVEGRALWTPVVQRYRETAAALDEATGQQKELCDRLWVTESCDDARRLVSERSQAHITSSEFALPLVDILDFRQVRAGDWWRVQADSSKRQGDLDVFYRSLETLYNVSGHSDVRVATALGQIPGLTVELDYWRAYIFRVLLRGDVWSACLGYVMSQDTRIHEIMVASGYQEMAHSVARVKNASLAGLDDKGTAETWFDEAAAWGWWLSDEIPAIVRRCVGQTYGECRLIGPTEISSMVARMAEGRRVAEDWSRRALIGLWNGLPALAIVVCLDIILICLKPNRDGHPHGLPHGMPHGLLEVEDKSGVSTQLRLLR